VSKDAADVIGIWSQDVSMIRLPYARPEHLSWPSQNVWRRFRRAIAPDRGFSTSWKL